MKTILISISLLFVLNTVSAQQQPGRNEQQVVFSVNIDCHSCEQKIVRNLGRARGVRNLTTSLEKQQVTILYRTNQTDKERLKTAIVRLGFTCEEVKPETRR